jgi:hypothetical protein
VQRWGAYATVTLQYGTFTILVGATAPTAATWLARPLLLLMMISRNDAKELCFGGFV